MKSLQKFQLTKSISVFAIICCQTYLLAKTFTKTCFSSFSNILKKSSNEFPILTRQSFSLSGFFAIWYIQTGAPFIKHTAPQYPCQMRLKIPQMKTMSRMKGLNVWKAYSRRKIGLTKSFSIFTLSMAASRKLKRQLISTVLLHSEPLKNFKAEFTTN